MKKRVLLVVALFSLAGCRSITCMGKTTLTVFNWGEYIDPATIKEFEKENNVCVTYAKFTSNEMAYIKMESQTYDVVFPSDYMIEKLAKENKIIELDWSKIEGFDRHTELSDQVSAIVDILKNDEDSFDFLKYASPYFAGQVGILYNTEVISQQEVESQGWEIFRNPAYKVAYYDSARDGFLVPLSQKGYPINNPTNAQIAEAKTWLLQQQSVLGNKLSYVTDEVLDEMINETYDVALVYSGDANYVITENDKMAFYRPEDKTTNSFIDGMVIPSKSNKQELAYKFISHMMKKETVKANSEYVQYTASRKDVVEELAEGELSNVKDSYNFTLNEDLDVVYRYVPAIQEKFETEWMSVIAAQNK